MKIEKSCFRKSLIFPKIFLLFDFFKYIMVKLSGKTENRYENCSRCNWTKIESARRPQTNLSKMRIVLYTFKKDVPISQGQPRGRPARRPGFTSAHPAPRAAGYATLASRSPPTYRGGARQCWPVTPGPIVEQDPLIITNNCNNFP